MNLFIKYATPIEITILNYKKEVPILLFNKITWYH